MKKLFFVNWSYCRSSKPDREGHSYKLVECTEETQSKSFYDWLIETREELRQDERDEFLNVVFTNPKII